MIRRISRRFEGKGCLNCKDNEACKKEAEDKNEVENACDALETEALVDLAEIGRAHV